MENASKALLIAGSVLIVILIIGVGMLVYQSIQGTIGEGIRQMSNQEKDMFNQQFTQYEGKMNGANVKALKSKVDNNNSQLEGTEEERKKDPKFVKWSPAEGITTINTARTYIVSTNDNNSDGLVDEVIITLP